MLFYIVAAVLAVQDARAVLAVQDARAVLAAHVDLDNSSVSLYNPPRRGTTQI